MTPPTSPCGRSAQAPSGVARQSRDTDDARARNKAAAHLASVACVGTTPGASENDMTETNGPPPGVVWGLEERLQLEAIVAIWGPDFIGTFCLSCKTPWQLVTQSSCVARQKIRFGENWGVRGLLCDSAGFRR
jgi:hypothetical protein